MPALDPAVAAVRTALRRHLDVAAAAGHLDCGAIGVACSGGADSLALAAAAAHLAPRRGLAVHGTVVDHGLQDDSAQVAARTAEQLTELGVTPHVVTAAVGSAGGLEAAARRARYRALLDARPCPGSLVLLGHTRDDQAETVLLGLGRGSGPRSIAGMRPLDPPWARPLLDITRETTAAACVGAGLFAWEDPHNSDARFTRVRLRREVLPLLEDVLQGGVSAALGRTAAQISEDCDALDTLADGVLAQARTPGSPTQRDDSRRAALTVAALSDEPSSVRRRVLRRWLLENGVAELTDALLREADAFVGRWRGQGPLALPGGYRLFRRHGELLLEPGGATPPNG